MGSKRFLCQSQDSHALNPDPELHERAPHRNSCGASLKVEPSLVDPLTRTPHRSACSALDFLGLQGPYALLTFNLLGVL